MNDTDRRLEKLGELLERYSKAVVAAVEEIGADAYIADRDYRRRQPEFADAAQHKERSRKDRARERRKEREARAPSKKARFALKDFIYDDKKVTCVCLAGCKLYQAERTCSSTGTASQSSRRR